MTGFMLIFFLGGVFIAVARWGAAETLSRLLKNGLVGLVKPTLGILGAWIVGAFVGATIRAAAACFDQFPPAESGVAQSLQNQD